MKSKNEKEPTSGALGGKKPLDLESLRARLAAAGGKQFWRSLEEVAGTEEYKEFLHHEFPHDPEKEAHPVSRRDVLKLMAASAAFAGLSACTKLPTEKIVPYVRAPEEIIPGKPLFYATAMPLGGIAAGLLVESHMGRPTKVEGNPEHPASLGATDIFAQAAVLTLYDPDRSQVVIHEGRIANWNLFLNAANLAREEHRVTKGAGLRLLTETITSPALADQIRAFLAELPLAKWHQYEPFGRDIARAGAKLAFGQYVNTVYRFDQADVILSLDADFLNAGPGSVRHARDFISRRDVDSGRTKMNRLYVVESTPSVTGAMADHRLPVRSSEVGSLARVVAEKLGVRAGETNPAMPSAVPADWIAALARDLERHRGASLVVAGENQPPFVHALAHAINQALGNVGKTVYYTEPLEAEPGDQLASLRELVADVNAGQVDTLLILGGNPVYTAPADFHFAEQLLKIKLRVHLGLYDDETSELCHWHIPEAHFLESWGDARAYDGTVSIIQPLIAPLYDGRSPHELLALFQGKPDRTAHDVVQEFWKSHLPSGRAASSAKFEDFWAITLHDGVMAGTALPPVPVSVHAEIKKQEPTVGFLEGPSIEIVFRPDPTIGDGRFANNGWLQELPKPLTQLTWDNAAMVSPATAQRLGVANEDLVEVSCTGRAVRAPVWIMPGHANDSLTLHCGYGRKRAGHVGTGIGFNAYAIRTSQAQ